MNSTPSESILDENVLFVSVSVPTAVRERLVPLMEECYPNARFVEADSLLDALEVARDGAYVVCLINESLEPDRVKTFCDDLMRMRRSGSSQTVQLCINQVGASEAPEYFNAAITQLWSPDDRACMKKVLSAFSAVRTHAERLASIGKAMDLLLRQLDKTAAERKKGRKKRLARIASGFIDHQMNRYQELSREYVDTLEKLLKNAQPAEDVAITVPEAVLKRALPELKEDGYKGVSDRVSEWMTGRFGKKKGDAD